MSREEVDAVKNTHNRNAFRISRSRTARLLSQNYDERMPTKKTVNERE